jgi:hypothetical protein
MDIGAESQPRKGGGPPGCHRSKTSHARVGAQQPSHPKHHSAQCTASLLLRRATVGPLSTVIRARIKQNLLSKPCHRTRLQAGSLQAVAQAKATVAIFPKTWQRSLESHEPAKTSLHIRHPSPTSQPKPPYTDFCHPDSVI